MSRGAHPKDTDAPPTRRGVVVSGTGLDERQQEAVAAPPGPVLILAGAGSGKTRVLTQRAAELAARPDIGAGAVVVITFTNRAAAELRARLAAQIGLKRSEQMTIGTFHAVCHRLLRSHPAHVGRSPQFSVYDGAATRKLIAATLKESGLDDHLPAQLVASQIGRAKARLVDPEGYRRLAQSNRGLQVAETFARYEQALARSDALDFDDLLVGAVELFDSPELLDNYRDRWSALLVDEYQDTNPAQDEWLRRLAGGAPNLTVVGDANQGVYSWRGADVRNILSFDRRFPGTRVVALERNYRSSGAIVACGAQLATRLDRRVQMWTDAPTGLAVVAIACGDERDEAEHAASWCRALLDQGTPPGEVAVLFRTRSQARAVEDSLLLAGVPSRMQGGQGLWESAAVRDLVAHLALLCNPYDRIALARALGCQPGVGKVTVARALGAGDQHDGDLVEACVNAATSAGLAGRQSLAVEDFGRALRDLHAALERRGVGETAVDTVISLGLADRLHGDRSEQSEEQLQRLRRFCRTARRYEQAAEDPTLADFLAQGALAGGEDEQAGAERVTLSTLHAAKGAEWDHVRLIGACEDLLPHRRAIADGDVDEERRLAYVAITRARQELAVSWPQTRYGRPTQVSRFVTEAGLAVGSTRSTGIASACRAA